VKVQTRPVTAPAVGDRPALGLSSRLLLAGSVVVVAVGLVLRFWTRSNLWLDEALTVNIARLPLRRIPGALRHDGAPPLYYLILHGWMRLFGTSRVAVRVLSGLFSVACLPLMWVAARRLARAVGLDDGGRRLAVAATVLLATSPFAIRYATEARMYSLVALLVLCGYLALTAVLDGPGREAGRPGWPPALGLAAASGLLLLTHYWALYLVAALAALLAVKARVGRGTDRGRRYLVALVSLLAGGVLFLPWVPTMLFQLRHTGTPWSEPASFSAMVNAISEFAGGRSSSGRGLGLLFFALGGFGLFGAAIDTWRVEVDLRTRPRGRGLALVIAGTLVLAILAGLASGGAFAARYTSVVFPMFVLLVALGTTVLADQRVRAGVLVAAAALGLGTASGNVVTNRTQVAPLVEAAGRDGLAPGDVVVYCPDQLGPAGAAVAPAGLRQVTFPALGDPRFVDWVDYGTRNAHADPAAFARAVSVLAGHHAVWLIWAPDYRTLGTSCEQVVQQLGQLRPPANQLVASDPVHYYEHANLVRYPPR